MFGRGKGPDNSGRSELASAIHDCRRALGGIVVFSGVMNILTLTGPLFMLQIYDRVVPSQSIPTLLGLAAIAALMYGALGFFDQVRARILIRDRRLCRRGGPPQGLPRHRHPAAEERAPRRRAAAAPRPRPDPLLHLRRRPGGLRRPAVPAVPDHHLLPDRPADRLRGDRRRGHHLLPDARSPT